MGKIEIVDDCFVPDKFIYLTYKGPDPFGVVTRITQRIRPFFHVSASGTNNTRINWDDSGDPIHFFSTWWVRRNLSRFSSMFVWINVIGTQSKTGDKGEFTLRLNADLKTSFEGIGVVLKPIWLIYSYLFYDRARRGFIENCRNYTVNFRNELKEHFNLEATQVPAARGAFG